MKVILGRIETRVSFERQTNGTNNNNKKKIGTIFPLEIIAKSSFDWMPKLVYISLNSCKRTTKHTFELGLVGKNETSYKSTLVYTECNLKCLIVKSPKMGREKKTIWEINSRKSKTHEQNYHIYIQNSFTKQQTWNKLYSTEHNFMFYFCICSKNGIT